MYIKEAIQKHSKYKYTYYQNTHIYIYIYVHTHTHTHTHTYAKYLIQIFAHIQQSKNVGNTIMNLTSLSKLWLFWADFHEIYNSSIRFCG